MLGFVPILFDLYLAELSGLFVFIIHVYLWRTLNYTVNKATACDSHLVTNSTIEGTIIIQNH